MKRITAVIIDTYPDKIFASLAIKMVQRFEKITKVITFSDTPFEEINDVDFVKISKLTSNNDYGKIIFDILPKYITDDFVLVFQWDGFILNPSNWFDSFLDYDYIGAPYNNWVGNGGFSIRSLKLLETLQDLKITIDLSNPYDQPEDQIIYVHNKELLEKNGIRYAPADLAALFSYENGPLRKNVFGFHSASNFPFFFAEKDLLKYQSNIVSRIPQPLTMISLLKNIIDEKMFDLLDSLLNNFEEDPNLFRTYQFLRAAPYPYQDLLKHFNSHAR